MNRLTLVRLFSGNDGTFGKLILPSGYSCFTAELPYKDNKKEISCIPKGLYKITPRQATNKFKYTHYKVLEPTGEEVMGRDNILIHVGNYAGDTSLGKKSDVEGCILVGDSVRITKINNIPQMYVANSRVTFNKVMSELQNKEYELFIKEI